MPPCESKLVSRSSRKATVSKTVFVELAFKFKQSKIALKQTLSIGQERIKTGG